ncbi:zn-finger domain-containing protein [Gigaspora margarita]|uniref:Zn-finger domain-containing protein n=1 Tax=Gigaspora margarita TaxID=4874 RepID=A0A8H4EKI1_GIGMA|nr:zn-finger domain-containing protein [Gigaspora margarita]
MQNNSSDDKNQEYDKFSNEAYADLMGLVTKYKLSNAAGNVIISFFNKHSNHFKSPLPKNIKQEKLFMNNIKSNLLYKKTKNGKENIYKEQNNGEWWKTTQSTLPTSAKILSIILYSDATNCDSLDIILESIQSFSENGTNLLLNNKLIWFYPKILTIIADWPEAATFCLTYKSTKSKHPCHFCLVKRDNLTNTNLFKKDMKLRNYDNMQYYYNKNKKQTISIESVPNIFGNLSKFNIF